LGHDVSSYKSWAGLQGESPETKTPYNWIVI
jgi:hypothetical protein